jgi:hypothetical protein
MEKRGCRFSQFLPCLGTSHMCQYMLCLKWAPPPSSCDLPQSNQCSSDLLFFLLEGGYPLGFWDIWLLCNLSSLIVFYKVRRLKLHNLCILVQKQCFSPLSTFSSSLLDFLFFFWWGLDLNSGLCVCKMVVIWATPLHFSWRIVFQGIEFGFISRD